MESNSGEYPCRICYNESSLYMNIYKNKELAGKQFLNILNDLLQLDIEFEDGFPQFICAECYKKVFDFEMLKRTAHEVKVFLLYSRDSFEIDDMPCLKLEDSDSEEDTVGMKPSSEEDGELKEWNTTDTGGIMRCSEGEEIEIEEHPEVLKIEQVDELNEECNTADLGGESRCSGSQRIGLEEHHAVMEMEQVEEPNEREFSDKNGGDDKAEFETPNKAIAHVSSVPDCLTVLGDINSEAAWHNQEHRVSDVRTVKGSLEMWNLESCEMPINQKESNDKTNEESAEIANGGFDNNEENIEECRNKVTNMYKGRLRNKMRNTNGNLADQYRKPNGKDCRTIRTNNGCQKKPLGTKNPGDLIACTASQKATKVKSVVKKIVGKPVIISKRNNSLRNRSRSKLRRFFCDTCKMGFRYKFLLGRHVRIHSGVRPYKCSICKKSFLWKESLLAHNSVHTVIGKPHVCTECGKSFKRKYSLELHKKLHRDYPFPCVTCGKFFRSEITLQEHLKIHGIVTPFSCNICKKYFVNKRNMIVHGKMHEDNRNKPFSCDTCKNSFKTKQHLKYHMYSHDTFKRHKCPICVKSFSLKSNLKRHMSCHSMERPYKCPNCSKCFNRMEYVKHHLKFFCKKN